MTVKQQMMDKIQAWLTNGLIENRLKIIVDHPRLAEVGLERIVLNDIQLKSISTSGYSIVFNEYSVLSMTFLVGDRETIELSLEENESFGGVFDLDDCAIVCDDDNGTSLYKNQHFDLEIGESTKVERHPLEVVMNELEFADWALREILDDGLYELRLEAAKENYLSVEEVQGLLDEVVATSPVGMQFTRVTFASGASIQIDNNLMEKTKKLKSNTGEEK